MVVSFFLPLFCLTLLTFFISFRWPCFTHLYKILFAKKSEITTQRPFPFQVSFDKRAGYIGFQTSDCGPEARITGPYNSSVSLRSLCKLASPMRDVTADTIKVAQWIVAGALTVAMTLTVYLLGPCVRARIVRTLTRTHTHISLTRAALVEEAT